jgi:hypothetical protein
MRHMRADTSTFVRLPFDVLSFLRYTITESESHSKDDLMAVTINNPATGERHPRAVVRDGHDITPMRNSPLQSVWGMLADRPTLGTLADVHPGIHFKADVAAECVSDEPRPDFVPGIVTAQGFLETYSVADYQYICTKPEVMRDHAHQLSWDRPKVIANGELLSRGIWSIAGAVDYQGIWLSQLFYGLWPRSGMPVEVLAAVISGPVANAFLFECPPDRFNKIRWIKQIPVPHFAERQTELIATLVDDYISQRTRWIMQPQNNDTLYARCLDLLYQIDAAVLEAYAMPASLEQRLLREFDGAERRPLPFEFSSYGANYERAKNVLNGEKDIRAIHERYHALVDQKFINGLTADETGEMEQLGRKIDDWNAPVYAKTLASLETARR